MELSVVSIKFYNLTIWIIPSFSINRFRTHLNSVTTRSNYHYISPYQIIPKGILGIETGLEFVDTGGGKISPASNRS